MFSKATLLLHLVLGTTVIALKKGECPPTDSIPCKCKLIEGIEDTVGSPHIDCQTPLLSEQDMGTLFATLQGYKLGALSFINTTFETANEDMYKGLHIAMLELDGVSVEKFVFKSDERYLTGLEKTLRILLVRNSFHSGAPLQHLQLDHMESLESVRYYGNKIVDLGNDWFVGGPKRLKAVMFEQNEIQNVGDRVFQALEGSLGIWLKGSALREIKRSMLPSPGTKLVFLDISSNKLTNLPEDLFSNLPSLGTIALDNNRIKSLSESIFPKNPILFLAGNPYHCDQELKWICTTFIEKDGMVCASPSNLAGTSFFDFCVQTLS